jgi:hypothetical protein
MKERQEIYKIKVNNMTWKDILKRTPEQIAMDDAAEQVSNKFEQELQQLTSTQGEMTRGFINATQGGFKVTGVRDVMNSGRLANEMKNFIKPAYQTKLPNPLSSSALETMSVEKIKMNSSVHAAFIEFLRQQGEPLEN